MKRNSERSATAAKPRRPRAAGEEADDFYRETVHTSSSGAVASPKVFSRTPILSMSER
jgi:hypothetical protein